MNVKGSGKDPWAFMVGMKIPLWAKKYGYGEKSAGASYESALMKIRNRENALASRLELAFFHAKDARRRMLLYKNSLIPRARRSYDLVLRAYEAGDAGILDVIEQADILLEFDLSFWRSCADFGKSLADLEALCGGKIR